MAALHGTFAFADHLHVAVLIAQHLKLDVAWRANVLFDVDIRHRESGSGLGLRLPQQSRQFVRPMDDAHAAPAPAGRSFDDHRVANLARDFERLFFAGNDAFRTRQRGYALALHRRPGLLL